MSDLSFFERRLLIDILNELQYLHPGVPSGIGIGPYRINEDGTASVEVNVYPSGDLDGVIGTYTLEVKLTRKGERP